MSVYCCCCERRTEYPVLHFCMAGGKHMEKEQLERYLGRRLVEQEKVWGITSPAVDANCFFLVRELFCAVGELFCAVGELFLTFEG